MHKVFGIREDAEYTDREGAYFIPVNGDKVGVIRTPKGYFFLGGGIENGESHIACIERECVEEAGYTVTLKEKVCTAETYCFHNEIGHFHPLQTYYVGEMLSKTSSPTEKDHVFLWLEYRDIKGKMYWEMQNWVLENIFEK